MISDPATAETVLAATHEAVAKLNDSICVVMKTESLEFVSAYKRAVGRVMCETFESILQPIYRSHPHLIPKDQEWLKQQLKAEGDKRNDLA